MINPLKTVVKCCGCIALTQLIGILVSLGLLATFLLVFYLYAVPWGEDQIREALQLPANTDIDSLDASIVAANNCSGCVFGVNTDWPTNTTGTLHFLDTSAGPTASAVIATSLVAGTAAGVGSMLWASFFPSAASVMSFSSGFYEMTHIIEQAQFIGMISQLQIDGAPVFLHKFSREMAWTNFNIPKSIDDVSQQRRLDTSLLSTTASGETGPKRYAALVGVQPKNLFFYTLLTFAVVVGAIHALFFLGVLVFAAMSKKKSFGQVASELYRKVIWACLLALLLAQYIFSMAGSFYIYENGSSEKRDSYFVWGTIGLIAMVGFAIVFGVLIIGSNRDELEDLGSYEHDQRPFAAKYSAYYDEYNFDNRFFFVPRILLAVSTGAVVGTIQDSTTQLLCILGITLLYLILLLWREPNLLRFLYYIGITSVFLKVVLVCMMLMLVQDDYFPQDVRDNVAYGIIGVNMFIFFLLFLRQAYTIIHKLVRGCKNKDKNRRSSSVDEVIDLERSNETPRNPPYARMESSAPFDNADNHYNKSGDQHGFNNQTAMAGHQQQQPMGFGNANQQGSQFARDNVGGAQPSAATQQLPSYTHQNAAAAGAGGVMVGATLGAAAARDRNNNNNNNNNENGDNYKNTGTNAGYDRAAPVYGAKVGDQRDKDSAAGANPSPHQTSANTNQFGKPLRKTSFDLDDMDDTDDGDFVAEPPAINQVSSVANAQHSTGVDRNPPPPNRQSYLRFTDSDMSFIDDDIDGRSPRSLNAAVSASGAGRLPPGSNTSVASGFSTTSSSADPFDRRSKTEIEDDDTALIVGSMGVATGRSIFDQRDSLESYTTENSNGLRANQSILTDVSDTSAAGASNNFDTESSMNTTGFSFGDDEPNADSFDDADDIKDADSSSGDGSDYGSRDVEDGEVNNGDIDIDELEPLSSPRDSLDSYGTQGEYSFGSLVRMDSKTSDSTVDLDNAASAYLRGVGDGEAQDDMEDDGFVGHGSNHRPANDSFFSAISTRSDDDASFYIDGQRRNTGSPPGGVGGAESDVHDAPRPNRTMKL